MWLCVALLGTAGCESLPAFGPSAQEISEAATTVVTATSDTAAFELVDLSARTMPAPQQRSEIFSTRFRNQLFLTEFERISVSDVLEVRIWETASDGLFASTGQRETILAFPVSNEGTITVPYAGRVDVAGLTTHRVREVLLTRFEGQAIDPEINVQIAQTAARTVAVLGAVQTSGQANIPAQGSRLLDVLAQMGGVPHPYWEVKILITRGSHRSEIRMNQLRENAANNIVILPSDTVQATHEPRRYAVFGAVSEPGRIDLNKAEPTLSDLLAEVGGLNDMQAAPNAIFVFRRSIRTGDEPTVYRLDFARADAFLLADQFVLRETDIVYVATADAHEFHKFITTLVSPFIGGVSSAQNLGD